MMRIVFLSVALALSAVALSQASPFPKPYNSEQDTNSVPLPAAAAAKMQVPPGFQATVFAAEPDVQNPIAIAWDARGRLWVAENYTYAESQKRFDLGLRDRILIFEDTDGDGRFDKRTVFTDDVQMLTSIEVGRGGVWLMCPPQLLVIPDRDGDDQPDGPAEVVLDGFTVSQQNYHNFANGLRFGPDGWLYGRCGGACPGELGLPGAQQEERIPLRSTMWRYHPGRKVVEVLSSGTTNPWGHDWDAHGELFFINVVNGHLWHGITGAHFTRKHTLDPNPRAYELIDQHADHWHYDISDATAWTGGGGAANAFGGGHAHAGVMIYQGDNWPAEYRGHLFTLNLHGRRVNQEILERSGSGYVGHHGTDVFLSEDKWFRGMELSYGPDGGVFVADWSDTGECHEHTGVHRESGRIFKITHSKPKRVEPFDLAKLNPRELVKLHTHTNEWFVRQARLQLAERAGGGRGLSEAKEQLRELFDRQADVVVKLRALWSLYVIGAADEKFLRAQLRHANEHVRVWAIRLLTDTWPLDTVMSQRPAGSAGFNPGAGTLTAFTRLARQDSSALVRLVLASSLQRLPVAQRAELATALVAHSEDTNDHNLPLMLWYGLIPLADSDPAALAKLAARCELPTTRKFIARRLAEDMEKNPGPVNDLLQLASAKPEAFQSDILAGLSGGLTGWRKARKPSAWDALAQKLANTTSPAIRDRVRNLSVLFGDGRALDEVKRVALDNNADLNARRAALQTLIESRPPDLRQICEQLLTVKFLNGTAARGLARFDDPTLGVTLAMSYRSFQPPDRAAVMDTLVSRPAFAKALLAEVVAGGIPRADVTAFHARQIRSFNDPALNEQLTKAWGELRESAADKRALITKLKAQLTPATLSKADKSAGRVVFTGACAACHRLYGQGGEIGPDLTGAGRDNLDYLLENIVDPSAAVNADFHVSVVDLKDDRTLNGVVAAKTDRTITLKTMTETVTLERAEIESIRESSLSLMPEGLLEGLNETQVRDLIAYLITAFAAPLPIRGLYVQFEQRGSTYGYWSGTVITNFNTFDPVVSHRVEQEASLQLDAMRQMGVNTITFELRATDQAETWTFEPPACNTHPMLGLQYPQPTTTEITNLVEFFDLVQSKGIKILLRLVNTHMEEQPPTNNALWLGAILNAVKNHPALDLVLFEGNTHMSDSNGDGVDDTCGYPAEPPLWMGPTAKPAQYITWAINYAHAMGLPWRKLSAQAVIGDFFYESQPSSGPAATDGHLWSPIYVLKRIFDDLSIPNDQRTYAVSFYQCRKCSTAQGLPCVDKTPHEWADETLQKVYDTIGRDTGARVVAVEMGLSIPAEANWSTEQAFESLIVLMYQYGVEGGCFWRWTSFVNEEDQDPALATPVKRRGNLFIYNPIKDLIVKRYTYPCPLISNPRLTGTAIQTVREERRRLARNPQVGVPSDGRPGSCMTSEVRGGGNRLDQTGFAGPAGSSSPEGRDERR